MPEPEKEFATIPIEIAIESMVAPSKAKGVATSSSRRKSSKKSVAFRPSKGQRKAGTSSDTILKRHTLRPNKQYWNTCPRNLKSEF